MNEKQFKKMNKLENAGFKEKTDSFEEEDSGIEIAEWAAFGLALGFVAVAVGFFLCAKYFK